LTPEEVEAFVLGTPPADPASFRRHIATCPECAERLAREARLELILEEVARTGARSGERSGRRILGFPLRRVWLAAAALLGLIAAVSIVSWRESGNRQGTINYAAAADGPQNYRLTDTLVTKPAYEVVSPRDLARDAVIPSVSPSGS
jgi:ferric-dicitrate binding protein FerR (iron transport regulator)